MQLRTVSVIIPTFNRSHLVPHTIESFVGQDYGGLLEIIVCDNSSSDDTLAVLQSRFGNNERVRIISEGRQGVHYARNTAAAAARGDLLYFTDDDMIADRSLLSELVPSFDDESVGTASGKVLPRYLGEPPAWMVRHCSNSLLSLIDLTPVTHMISRDDFGVYSCHQMIPRTVFFMTNGFHPENTAGTWVGDGETGLNRRIRELGYNFSYNGRSVTYHVIPQSRLSQTYLNQRLFNQGRSDCYTYLKGHRGHEIRALSSVARALTVHVLRVSVRALLLRDTPRKMISAPYYCAGFLSGLRLYFTNAEYRELVHREKWI